MYQGPEWRVARRVPAQARVAIQIDGLARPGRALDVSETGLFFSTPADLARGRRVTLTLAFAPCLAFELVGDVIREDPSRGGFGVRFVEVPKTAQLVIRTIVAGGGPPR